MASNTPPFLVHLIFHPASDKARNAALALHKALNSDSALPGLAVPTALLPEDGSGLPAEAVRPQPGQAQCGDHPGR